MAEAVELERLLGIKPIFIAIIISNIVYFILINSIKI